MSEISIIIPVYNAEKYLSRCIDSIFMQTFTDFELILVDDGSPDRCGLICDEYMRRDSRVRVLHQSNQGQAAARNNGVNVANGEWITFVDADDMVHPQMLEMLYRSVNEHSTLVSIGNAWEGEYPPKYFENMQLYHSFGSKIGDIHCSRYSMVLQKICKPLYLLRCMRKLIHRHFPGISELIF